MKRLLFAALPLAFCSVAAAQTPPAQVGAANVPAPWWMKEPVIASIGNVRLEMAANRAHLGATFQVIDHSPTVASQKAADKVRELARALAAYGAQKAQIETNLVTTPLYDQYRDKQGEIQQNQRADKIDAYEVTATLSIEIRDVALVEPIYAALLAARPTSIQSVQFELVPSNEINTRLQEEAVKDAARRARLAAEAAGGRVMGIKVIDPTGRACRTDVLAGWPSYLPVGAGGAPHDVTDELVVTGSRAAMANMSAPAPPPPPPPGGGAGPDVSLPLQPPIRELYDTACVVYGLAG